MVVTFKPMHIPCNDMESLAKGRLVLHGARSRSQVSKGPDGPSSEH